MHRIKRCSSSFNTQRLDNNHKESVIENSRFELYCEDMSDTSDLSRLMRDNEPDKYQSSILSSKARLEIEI